MMPLVRGQDGNSKILKKLVYTYRTPWTPYGLAWSPRRDLPPCMAVSSFIEGYTNKIQLVQYDAVSDEFRGIREIDHPYPPSKIQYCPRKWAGNLSLFATTSDSLRIFAVDRENNIGLRSTLINQQVASICGTPPLPSMDWNPISHHLIAVCSVDTTCTVWDLEVEKSRTQLIAHDKEVYDVAFSPHFPDRFATCSADGSVRTFDLRALENSTIVYEHPRSQPVMRVSWNRDDSNIFACFGLDDSKVTMVDIRMPTGYFCELEGHSGPLNCLAWSPDYAQTLCTGGDDSNVLLWPMNDTIQQRLQEQPQPGQKNPEMAPCLPSSICKTSGPVNQITWSSTIVDRVAVVSSNSIQVLKV